MSYKVIFTSDALRDAKRLRAISCVKLIDETVYLVAIYDKSEADTISEGDLGDRLLNIP